MHGSAISPMASGYGMHCPRRHAVGRLLLRVRSPPLDSGDQPGTIALHVLVLDPDGDTG